MTNEYKDPSPDKLPTIADNLAGYDQKTLGEKEEAIDRGIGGLMITEGLFAQSGHLVESGKARIREVADREVARILNPSESADTHPRELRQPLPKVPEATGDVIKDKAHMWLYSASWEAARASREAAVREAEEEARRSGKVRPDYDQIGQPDFTPEDSALLTKIAKNIESPGMQQMLARLSDLRVSRLQAQNTDNLRDQMVMLGVVLQNPDFQALFSE